MKSFYEKLPFFSEIYIFSSIVISQSTKMSTYLCFIHVSINFQVEIELVCVNNKLDNARAGFLKLETSNDVKSMAQSATSLCLVPKNILVHESLVWYKVALRSYVFFYQRQRRSLAPPPSAITYLDRLCSNQASRTFLFCFGPSLHSIRPPKSQSICKKFVCVSKNNFHGFLNSLISFFMTYVATIDLNIVSEKLKKKKTHSAILVLPIKPLFRSGSFSIVHLRHCHVYDISLVMHITNYSFYRFIYKI